jgi:RNA ligase (TIGR02306 family)
MSTWSVLKERIVLFPHPNADKLQLGKVGPYQVVVPRGSYADGDVVLFVPEKSILTGAVKEAFSNYLVGPDKDRVKSISLRGEMSCGVILSDALVQAQCGTSIADLPEGADLSTVLGVTRYVPRIPSELSGEVGPIKDDVRFGQHDCEQFGVYATEFQTGEDVVITEKLHGSQAVLFLDLASGYRFVTSKGYLGKGLCLTESDRNAYWRASGPIWSRITESVNAGVLPSDAAVQVFGELVPCQGDPWNYGYNVPTLKIFDLRMNGTSVPYDVLAPVWGDVWVPVLYRGPFLPDRVRHFREGREHVSGKQLNIREGAVVRPYVDRRAADSTRLVLKMINPAYKETGEEIN